MSDSEDSVFIILDYLQIIWKRRWFILFPTLGCMLLAGVISFLLPKTWTIDMIIQPAKFVIQTASGQLQEILVSDPQQVAGQINQESYNEIVANELHISLRDFPEVRAQQLLNTELVRIFMTERDVERAKLILTCLFSTMKKDLDKKTDVEIKGIDTEIAKNENLIKYKELTIREELNTINGKEIGKNKIRQAIASLEKQFKISEQRVRSILEEMKSVKRRIDEIETRQRDALSEKKENAEALGLLLYSNEIQENLRYYNTLDENWTMEQINQEKIALTIKDNKEELKRIDTEIEALRISMDKIRNEILNVNDDIGLLNDKKGRMDYTKIIKVPSSSVYPASPKKKLNVAAGGIMGLVIFTLLAFLREYSGKKRAKENPARGDLLLRKP